MTEEPLQIWRYRGPKNFFYVESATAGRINLRVAIYKDCRDMATYVPVMFRCYKRPDKRRLNRVTVESPTFQLFMSKWIVARTDGA